MAKIFAGIYKITSPSNAIYIGQSWNLGHRKRAYRALMCEDQPRIYNSLKKYGFDNHQFEVVYRLPLEASQESMNEYEIFIWAQYKEAGREMMNIKLPGSKGKHSEETKKKLSEMFKGRKLSEEQKKKIKYKRQFQIMTPKTDEEKKRMVERHKKYKETPDEYKQFVEKNRIAHLGKKASDETKAKMSKAHKGVKSWSKGLTKETSEGLKKMSENRKGIKQSEQRKKEQSERFKLWWAERKKIKNKV